jgi:putative peptidoglycan lipid II flippase
MQANGIGMSTNKSIAKSAGIISIATLISRILGFVRDIIFAAFFGTGIYAQAFVVAFRIPNLLRDLIGEGATNSAVVPVLVEELSLSGKDAFWKLANILLNLLLVVLTVLTIIGFVFARPIVFAIAPGFVEDPLKFDITVALTKAIFPYLIFIGLTAYGMGVLNSIKHFTAPAYGTSLLNISMIACMFIWRQDVIGLAAGVLLGGIMQVAIQIPVLLKSGIVFSHKYFTHPQVRKILRLLVPRVFGSGVYQINVFVSTILASIGRIVGEGAVAALYFSNRIMQLPLAIFAIALAQAALPTLSGHVVNSQKQEFAKTINFLLRSVFFLLLPASAGLIVLSEPITRILLQRGAFGAYSTHITSSALFFYSFGLLAYGAIKILVNGFYAMQDTRTPVKVAAISLVVNISLSVIFMFRLKVGGLALANSLSGILNAVMLFLLLKKKAGTLYENSLIVSLFKIFIASVLTGAFAYWLNAHFSMRFDNGSLVHSAAGLMISIFSSAVFYLIICRLMRIKELAELRSWILKKR